MIKLIRFIKKILKVLKIENILENKTVHYIGGSDTLPPPLSKEEEEELIERLKAG